MNDDLRTGYYTIEWNGKNDYGVKVSSGVYIYRIVAGKFVQTKKMMLLK
jgi:flagellar hook assembly protein FlgD